MSALHARTAAVVGLAATQLGCSGSPPPRPWQRDVTVAPIVVTFEAGPTIYAVSDVHGGDDRLAALLARHGASTTSSR